MARCERCSADSAALLDSSIANPRRRQQNALKTPWGSCWASNSSSLSESSSRARSTGPGWHCHASSSCAAAANELFACGRAAAVSGSCGMAGARGQGLIIRCACKVLRLKAAWCRPRTIRVQLEEECVRCERWTGPPVSRRPQRGAAPPPPREFLIIVVLGFNVTPVHTAPKLWIPLPAFALSLVAVSLAERTFPASELPPPRHSSRRRNTAPAAATQLVVS